MYSLVDTTLRYGDVDVFTGHADGAWRLTVSPRDPKVAAVTDDAGLAAAVFVEGKQTATLERHDYYTIDEDCGAHKTFLVFSPTSDEFAFETEYSELTVFGLDGAELRKVDLNHEFIGPWWLVGGGKHILISGWIWQPFFVARLLDVEKLFSVGMPGASVGETWDFMHEFVELVSDNDDIRAVTIRGTPDARERLEKEGAVVPTRDDGTIECRLDECFSAFLPSIVDGLQVIDIWTDLPAASVALILQGTKRYVTYKKVVFETWKVDVPTETCLLRVAPSVFYRCDYIKATPYADYDTLSLAFPDPCVLFPKENTESATGTARTLSNDGGCVVWELGKVEPYVRAAGATEKT